MNRKQWLGIIFYLFMIFWITSLIVPVKPSKAEVDRFFEENRCELKNIPAIEGGEEYCVHYLRRHTNSIWGQINFIKKYGFLFFNTPFHYYRDMELVTTDEGDETFYRYTWVDTMDGRLVYDAVTGEYIKKISSNIDPAKAYYEEMDKYVEKMKNLQENTICSYNAYNCVDFSTQAEAQAVYYKCKREVGSDIHHLDGDDDGKVCEGLK